MGRANNGDLGARGITESILAFMELKRPLDISADALTGTAWGAARGHMLQHGEIQQHRATRAPDTEGHPGVTPMHARRPVGRIVETGSGCGVARATGQD